MLSIEKEVLVKMELNAFDIAELFWSMDSDEQATFFVMVGKNKIYDLAKQLEAVSQSKDMNLDGRNFMKQIGDYSWPNNE